MELLEKLEFWVDCIYLKYSELGCTVLKYMLL